MTKKSTLLEKLREFFPFEAVKHVGIIAPAGFSCDKEVEDGIEFLKNLGLKVSLFAAKEAERNINNSYLSDNTDSRMTALEYSFCDESLDLLICTRGGFGCVHLLEGLDWELIRYRQLSDNPLAIIGYSDITALNLAMLSNVGVNNDKVAIAGVMSNRLPLLLDDNDEFSLTSWVKSISRIKNNGDKKSVLELNNLNIIKKNCQSDISGRLLPLNLAVTASLCGADFMTSELFEDKIIVIEDINEPLYKVDRYLQQIMLSGIFKGIKGIVLGQFSGCGDYSAIENLVEKTFNNDERFKNLELIASGIEFGHDFPLLSLVWNEEVVLKS